MDYKFPNLSKLIHLHNNARSNSWLHRLNPLKENTALMNYAHKWAVHMADSNKLYHSDMFGIMSMGFSLVGENIAMGQQTEESVMKSWLSSLGHRKNIMNKVFTDMGCGFAYADDDTMYWCVCFGSIKK